MKYQNAPLYLKDAIAARILTQASVKWQWKFCPLDETNPNVNIEYMFYLGSKLYRPNILIMEQAFHRAETHIPYSKGWKKELKIAEKYWFYEVCRWLTAKSVVEYARKLKIKPTASSYTKYRTIEEYQVRSRKVIYTVDLMNDPTYKNMTFEKALDIYRR